MEKIDKKNIIKLIKNSYTVPLEESIDNDNKLYIVNDKSGGNLIPGYIFTLKRAIQNNTLIELPNEINKFIKSKYNMENIWGKLFIIDSALLTNGQPGNKVISNNNITSSGHAGNVSLSYFTISQINQSFENLYGKNFYKLISKIQYDLLTNTNIYILFEKNDENFLLDCSTLTEQQFNEQLENNINNNYTPVRIIFENITPEQSLLFNTKIINRKITRHFDEFIEQNYIQKYNSPNSIKTIKKMSNKEIKSKFNININEYLDKYISNERFLVTLVNNIPISIEIINTAKLYFGKVHFDTVDFDSESLVNKDIQKVRYDNPIYIDKNKNEHIVELKIRDMEYYYKMANYNNILSKEKEEPNGIPFWKYFFVKESKNLIYPTIKNIKNNAISFNDNEKDQNIQEHLQKLLKDSSILSLHEIEHHNISDKQIIFKSKSQSDVEVKIYDRYHSTPYSNIANNLQCCLLHKSNFSFERERTLTIIFIEKFIELLKEHCHNNIEIEMESPTNTFDNNIGYLDLIIKSELNGHVFGQVFEFKAHNLLTLKLKEEMEKQANNYNVINKLNQLGISKYYNQKNIGSVISENLTIERIDYLIEQANEQLSNLIITQNKKLKI